MNRLDDRLGELARRVGRNLRANVPISLAILQLRFFRVQCLENPPYPRFQVIHAEPHLNVHDRPADVAGLEAEEALGRRREPPDTELVVDHQHRHGCAFQKIRKIVAEFAQFLNAVL